MNKYVLELLDRSLPFFKKLDDYDRERLLTSSAIRNYKKGTMLTNGEEECIGLIIVKSGQLRAYTVNEEGKEITLYRLLEGDVCIMSASCMLKDINFNIILSFEHDSNIVIIPTYIYELLNEKYIEVKNYTLNLVSGRFSDVMWILQQYVFLGMAKRVANALIEQSILSDNMVIKITHEELAKDLGTAREVITRLLKQFSDDGLIKQSRSKIQLLDRDELYRI